MSPPITNEDVINEFSVFLKERALALQVRVMTPAGPESLFPMPTINWLMEEILPLLEKGEWDTADVSRLSALFFFLMAAKP